MFLQLLCAEGKSVSGSGGTAGFHWQTWAPAPSFLQGWLLLPEVAAGGRQRAAVCFSSVCRLNPAKAAACVRADARKPQLNAGIRVNTPRASRGSLQLSVRARPHLGPRNVLYLQPTPSAGRRPPPHRRGSYLDPDMAGGVRKFWEENICSARVTGGVGGDRLCARPSPVPVFRSSTDPRIRCFCKNSMIRRFQ